MSSTRLTRASPEGSVPCPFSSRGMRLPRCPLLPALVWSTCRSTWKVGMQEQPCLHLQNWREVRHDCGYTAAGTCRLALLALRDTGPAAAPAPAGPPWAAAHARARPCLVTLGHVCMLLHGHPHHQSSGKRAPWSSPLSYIWDPPRILGHSCLLSSAFPRPSTRYKHPTQGCASPQHPYQDLHQA